MGLFSKKELHVFAIQDQVGTRATVQAPTELDALKLFVRRERLRGANFIGDAAFVPTGFGTAHYVAVRVENEKPPTGG
jgi:hypothetical protein